MGKHDPERLLAIKVQLDELDKSVEELVIEAISRFNTVESQQIEELNYYQSRRAYYMKT